MNQKMNQKMKKKKINHLIYNHKIQMIQKNQKMKVLVLVTLNLQKIIQMIKRNQKIKDLLNQMKVKSYLMVLNLLQMLTT